MKRALRLALVVAFASLCQAQYTAITGTFGDASGNAQTGLLSCYPADGHGNAISFLTSNGQTVKSPVSCPITSGAVASGCKLADTSETNPQNVCFQCQAKNSATNSVFWGPFPCVQPSGSTFSLNTLAPSSAPLALVAAGAQISGTPAAGNCAKWVSGSQLGDAGAPCGTGSGGGGGAVASVFGRTGTVIAQSGDYSYSQISGTPTSWAWSGISGVPSTFPPPTPTLSVVGGVKSVDCSATGASLFVQKINTDGSETCVAAPSSGGGMANPMTTINDIIVGSTSGTPQRLASGSNGTYLGLRSGAIGYYAIQAGDLPSLAYDASGTSAAETTRAETAEALALPKSSVSSDTTLGGGSPSTSNPPSQSAVQTYVSAHGGGIGGATSIGSGLTNSSGALTTVGQQPSGMAFSTAGLYSTQQVLFQMQLPFAVTIPTNCADSVGISYLAFPSTSTPTASWTATINKIHSGAPTAIGTVTVPASGTSGSFTCTATSLAAGDWYQVVAPTSVDATAASANMTQYWVR